MKRLVATFVALGLGVPGAEAAAQKGLIVEVIDAASGVAVEGAVVNSARSRIARITDRVGSARFQHLARPDTVVVTRIGYAPTTRAVGIGVDRLSVAIEARPVMVSEVSVTAAVSGGLAVEAPGEWRIPRSIVLSQPAAVQADLLRSLAVVPSVSFSSPLSARPTIRGYDASDTVTRIDGFEVITPFHLGRIFSGFSADATQSVSVDPAPAPFESGGTLGGSINIRGRRGSRGRGLDAGFALSPVEGSGWIGSDGYSPYFIFGRTGFLGPVVTVFGDGQSPYDFQEFFGHKTFQLGGRNFWDITALASRDDFADVGAGSGMEWSNILVGNRVRMFESPAFKSDAEFSINSHRLRGRRVEFRDRDMAVNNRFSRVNGGVSAEITRGIASLQAGFNFGRRGLANATATSLMNARLPQPDEDLQTELRTFAGIRLATSRFVFVGSVLWERSDSASTAQPRLRVSAQLGKRVTASLNAARASRLFQIVSEPQPEPTLAFPDVWLRSGFNGVAVPRVDHLSAGVNVTGGGYVAHVAGFLSSGEGLGEVRPEWDFAGDGSQIRFGESRTRGLEVRVAKRRGEHSSIAFTYVLSSSDRKWSDAVVWVPWRLDRRHMIRVNTDFHLGSNWSAGVTAEGFSGQPVTPVRSVFWGPGGPRYDYAREGSGRSAGTFHVDLALRRSFRWPGDGFTTLGISVINLGFGPVAPDKPVSPGEAVFGIPGVPRAGGVPYERSFSLPAVPSVTLRIEF